MTAARSVALCLLLLSACADQGRYDELPLARRELPADMRQLESLLRPDTGDRLYKPPTAAEEWLFVLLVPELSRLSSPADPRLTRWHAAIAKLGYSLERWRVNGDEYVILKEDLDHLRGSGTYVFRVPRSPRAGAKPVTRVILQAPHTFFDRGTRGLAIEAFFIRPGRARLAALHLNSMHRYQNDENHRRPRTGNSPADVCHNTGHLFQLVTKLTAESETSLTVMQLHGFSSRVDHDVSIDAVVSTSPPLLGETIATALKRQFAGRIVRRYPDEYGDLGGAANVQAGLLRKYPRAHFIHLELSSSFRKNLIDNRPRVTDLMNAVLGAVPGVAEAPR